MREHASEKKFKCEDCPYQTSRLDRIKMHKRSVHDKIKDQVCQECGAAFSVKGNLKMHMYRVHLNKEKKFR